MLDFGAIILMMTAVEDSALACRIFTSHSLDYFLQHSGLYAAEDGGAGLERSEDSLTAAFQLQVVQECPVCPLSTPCPTATSLKCWFGFILKNVYIMKLASMWGI